MDLLLETIVLLAEIQELKATVNKNAIGAVLETHRDPKRGISATLLVQDGTLKRHDIIVMNRNVETIRMLDDFMGMHVDHLGPSSPALVTGLSHVPTIGEPFLAFSSKPKAQEYIKQLPPLQVETKKISVAAVDGENEKSIFNIILKSDVVGSKEAIEESLKKLESDTIGIVIIRSEVGDINENDVKLALATHLITIVGFKVHIDPSVQELARNQNIHIINGDVIYHLLDEVKRHVEDIIPPIVQRTVVGKIKILKLFKKDGNKQVIGGRVDEGIANKKALMNIIRGKETLGDGIILQLQREKREVEEVAQGNECGILADSSITIREGDICEIYREEKIKRTL
jgi:translation initiation factor IF-2